MSKSRFDWTDRDWAIYLGCPVHKVSEFKRVLDDNFIPTIERDKKTGKYFFSMYRYYIAPSGHEELKLLMSADQQFGKLNDALCDANNIISTLELGVHLAEELNIPDRAIQMMLMRTK